ncbi:beta-N-acetylhexosaminidase [Paenibacillus brevis]|uniref:Beta-N-acetylhexosaminidase n=1 Tax=Paenibacillus brevis TaxID=2841508 RepID=A0ABS6FRS2_9BACL|nr:beta-N-acetylhexosaminidase [Paenibacillus brevis]MBU5672937.1 beta-N-acetylhexosaminidase [Paenibacillus brevis]
MNESAWSLEEKIGQLFICGFHSLETDEQILTLVKDYHVGGTVYFRRNIESVPQLAALSSALQRLPRNHADVPLFIAIDQEGGMVARLDHEGMSRIPGNMSLGAADDLSLTEATARLAAKEMLDLGINFNFAPCIDVNNNPANPVIGVRSFGENPLKVAEHGVAAITGYQQQGVIATAKHFPGHGDTAVDSHRGLASVPHDKERLNAVELLPFRHAITAGVDAIMTAHVIFPAFEPDGIPATLSRKVLTDLLRTELGYQGVIVTDCLEMHAISKESGIAEGAVQSIEAGADLVLVSHTLRDQIAAIEAVKTAVKEGRITEERINQSVERVLRLKEQRLGTPTFDSGKEVLADPVQMPLTPEGERVPLLTQIAEKSVTLVKKGLNFPLDAAKPVLVVWPELRHRTEVDEPAVHRYTLADALEKCGVQVELAVIGTYPEDEELEQVLKASLAFDQIAVVTYTAEGALPEGQKQLVQELCRIHDDRVVAVSTRNPYDINEFPEAETYLCLYENRSYALDALAKMITGRLKPTGVLPVGLNSSYPAGYSHPLN